jgi:urease accessory protein
MKGSRTARNHKCEGTNMNAFLLETDSRRGSRWRWLASMLLVLIFPTLANAHVGAGPANGLLSGFGHPVSGLDHLCAMIAVGIWAAQCGGMAIWLVPVTFVVVMGVGGALGMAAVSIPFVEPGIVASVLVLGLMIAVATRLPIVASVLLVGLFALFHGHAHGNEMPATAAGLAYAEGFMAGTVSLLLFGIGVGVGVRQLGSAQLVRFAGGAIAACGLFLCFA